MNASTLAAARQFLIARGHAPIECRSGADCVARFIAGGSDLVVACLPLGDVDGANLLRSLRDADASVQVILAGNDDAIRGPLEAYELGALEHVADPGVTPQELLAAVGVALGSRRGDAELRYLREKDAAIARKVALVGECDAMKEVLRVVEQICARTTRSAAPTVLLTGETGTGKGLLARYLHDNGCRRTRPFVEVNCAAIPDMLLESELFGHERGAFTDARTRRVGLFETANDGTLFLDEIGNVPLELQAKLLTAIEEKRIRRVGASHTIAVNVQIVAATHADLKAAVKADAFRADLYHRLNVVSVRMPPLRERGDDKLVLAERFVTTLCTEYGLTKRRLSAEAKEHILRHSWPGNVRELRNQIERILLVSNDAVIEANQFDSGFSTRPPEEGFVLALPQTGVALDHIERVAIVQALDMCRGNVSRAARFLQVTRQTLIYRMRKHGLRGGTDPTMRALDADDDDDAEVGT
jgi:DNA-binding NtrC family response regulator